MLELLTSEVVNGNKEKQQVYCYNLIQLPLQVVTTLSLGKMSLSLQKNYLLRRHQFRCGIEGAACSLHMMP
jgi:hypothetical protein